MSPHQIETEVLRRLAELTQTQVAQAACMSESALSKWKSHDLEPTARILSAMGLAIVPASADRPDPAYVASLEVLARMTLDRQQQERLRRSAA